MATRTALEQQGDLHRAEQALSRFAEAMKEATGEVPPEVAMLQTKLKATIEKVAIQVVAEEKMDKERQAAALVGAMSNIRASLVGIPGSITQGNKP